jgi:hypothetical protein
MGQVPWQYWLFLSPLQVSCWSLFPNFNGGGKVGGPFVSAAPPAAAKAHMPTKAANTATINCCPAIFGTALRVVS